jgi:cytochrome c peroxidase
VFVVAAGGVVAACSNAATILDGESPTATSFYAARFERQPTVAELTELGRTLFANRSLSASGKLACASCHDPEHAYGPSGDAPVALGGPDMTLPGVRAIPSLAYSQAAPPFDEHFTETEGDDSVDQGPAGGRGWDGRAGSAHEQAAIPLLSPFEMANPNGAAVIERLRRSSSAAPFRATFGNSILSDDALSWKGVLLALEVFQQSPSDFYPYSSKYDAWLRGMTALTESEKRGLELFNDPSKGNCAECHPSAIKRGAFPQFTDYGFLALGAPRNPRIPVNADPNYYDLGLCGPWRTDLAGRADYCGLFKTPTLRNVALRQTFFHNGAFGSLEDVVRFYVERDQKPEKFYPRRTDGSVASLDDLPPDYRANINAEAPFRTASGKPALSDGEIADVVSFLKTLTDGFRVLMTH